MEGPLSVTFSNIYIPTTMNLNPRHWAIRRWVQLALRANFVQLLQFHLFVQCSHFILAIAFVSCNIHYIHHIYAYTSYTSYIYTSLHHIYFTYIYIYICIIYNMCPSTVHELPQRHCGDNREGTLFSWLHCMYIRNAEIKRKTSGKIYMKMKEKQNFHIYIYIHLFATSYYSSTH